MSAVVIRIDGVDITDDVLIKGATFNSQVNGVPGLATLRVKDLGHTYEFISGGSLSLDVDGVRVWGGYVLGAKKVYPLSVIDTIDPPAASRIWEITGGDYNLLFTKRIVFKESDPTGKLSFRYDADTYDDTIIEDIFDNYLDIADDDLTRTGVQRIAKAILDVPGKSHRGEIAAAGYTWKQMMDSVQRATGGVYYLDALRDLKYVDVEVSTSDYTLTDQPSGAFDVGYQKFILLENGADLVNDALVWGAGTGSSDYVFSRSEDSASISAHGRWQLPLVTSGLFRQASADLVADSYVYGTPQSKRGGKDDAVAFNVRVFEPRFAAGDVVDVVCGIFGYSDALPVRRMTTTFVSPTEPIFDLVLSHSIDQPLTIYEFGLLDIDIDIDDPRPPPPPPEVCAYRFDDFDNRVVLFAFGSAPDGHAWDQIISWTAGDFFFWGVDGFSLYMIPEIGTDDVFGAALVGSDALLPYNPWAEPDFTMTVMFYYDTALATGDHVFFRFKLSAGAFELPQVGLALGNVFPFAPALTIGTEEFVVHAFDLPTNPPPNVPIYLRWHRTQGDVNEAKVWWDTDPEPDWQVSGTVGSLDGGEGTFIYRLDVAELNTLTQFRLEFIDFDWCASGAINAGGVPSEGYVCETVSHLSGGTAFEASWAFRAGTLRVWVNGLRRTDLTVIDPTTGAFVLGTAIVGTDKLRICYYANGAPV